jgi:acyl carrier protein
MANMTYVTTQIIEALEELNQQLPPEQQLPVSSDTPLFGHGGWLDSLGLVNLIVIVEERIFSKFGIEIALSDDQAISQQDSPFRNVQTLTEYVSKLIDANAQQAEKE